MKAIYDFILLPLLRLKFIHSGILIVCLVILTIPRFNWGKLGSFNSLVGDKPFDIKQYEAYTEFFRGDLSKKEILEGPFSYRPFVPLMASFLPFSPLTAINVINLLALILSLPLINKILMNFELDYKYRLLAQAFHVFSFPVFYYGTSGYVDSVMLFFIFLILYLLIRSKYLMLLITIAFGMSVKETIIIFYPVIVSFFIIKKDMDVFKKIVFPVLILIIFIIESYFLRTAIAGKPVYLWTPRYEVLVDNITRLKTYLSFLLSFGLPGIGSVFYLFSSARESTFSKMEIVFTTGFMCALLLSVFSIFTAYSDGRHIWLSYPFTIPLSIAYMKQKRLGFLKLFNT